jgi:hypothetical protein
VDEFVPRVRDYGKDVKALWLDRLIPEGHVYREVDGFFVFAPRSGFGAIEPWALRAVADYIDGLNAPWAAELKRSLSDGA